MNTNSTPTYTEEELATLPQTDTVFDAPELQFGAHEWIQMGYMLHDNCQTKSAGCYTGAIPIGSGRMLVKNEKGYHVVDELNRKK